MTLTPDSNKDLEFHQPTTAQLHLRINKLDAELTTLKQLLCDQSTTNGIFTSKVAAELGVSDQKLTELYQAAAMESYKHGLNRSIKEEL